jgi:hypothetical protein
MKTRGIRAFVVLALFSSALAFAAAQAAQGGPATQSDKELKRSFFMAGVGAG